MRQRMLINADGSIKIESREVVPEDIPVFRMYRLRPPVCGYTQERNQLPVTVDTATFKLALKTRHYDIYEEVQP